MKKPIILPTVIIITALSGCNKPSQPIILNKVENLMKAQPDSAYSLLVLYSTGWNVYSTPWNIYSSPWNVHSSPWNIKPRLPRTDYQP